jgi:VIT1/CCC1 family predicted Fe2+/Mn2+ transporter
MTTETPGVLATPETREPVLDTVERVSEMCFGLFMALTFVGAVSAATAGQDPGRTMLAAALGCNLAWGLVDAVMYLVRNLTERGRRLTLALAVQAAPDAATAIRALRDALPSSMRALMGDGELDVIRARLATADLPARPRLGSDDYMGALGIFLIVVLSTFPVALPFLILSDMPVALVISRALTLAMLFGGGMALGRHAGYGSWKAGFGMVSIGVALTLAIIAMGG